MFKEEHTNFMPYPDVCSHRNHQISTEVVSGMTLVFPPNTIRLDCCMFNQFLLISVGHQLTFSRSIAMCGQLKYPV